MGIFDFVKQGVQEMLIQRPDEHKSALVYKHPDSTIPNHAQLTVDADEAAVFFRDGSIVGTLRTAGAGHRHTLSAQNIPFLSGLVDKVTGGNVFITDLYFVTVKPVFDQRFGGELGYVEDPILGEMVTPRIFGTYALQIVNPERFIVGYVGMGAPGSNDEVTAWLTGKLMNGIKTVIGEVCVAEQKSMLELLPMQNKLAQMFQREAPDLASVGVRVVEIGEFKLNLNDDDRQRLQKAQAEIGTAKRAAKVAQIGISQAEAEAKQRQFKLDQDFSQDARYTTALAGGDFARYAAGRAMMGAGEGMAQGGGEGGAGHGVLRDRR
ncbi:MAG: SPFH domain-containing protein, partial [Myxococcales bacterium]|nr:SPFH domain-containing protein [Myxococcales bacterium]